MVPSKATWVSPTTLPAVAVILEHVPQPTALQLATVARAVAGPLGAIVATGLPDDHAKLGWGTIGFPALLRAVAVN